MIDNIKPGEIVFCNLHFKVKKDVVISREQVFSREFNGDVQTSYSIKNQNDEKFLKKHGIKFDATLFKVEIIKSMGFKNAGGEHSVVQKSERDERQKNGSFI